MPERGTLLTDIEKGRIIGMRDSGKTRDRNIEIVEKDI